MPYKFIKWYHWIWMWVLPTNVADDSGKYQYTKVTYKRFMDTMYVIKLEYRHHRSNTRRTK